MLLKRCLSLAAIAMAPVMASGQAAPTAIRDVAIQVGATVSLANPGIDRSQSLRYGEMSFLGAGAYVDVDASRISGLEVNIRQLEGTEGVHERTYQIGPRFHKRFGRSTPYVKFLAGRAVFDFPNSFANLAFNEGSVGGGLDFRIKPAIAFRLDYERQRWFGFSDRVSGFPGQLGPAVASVGVAYRMGGTRPRSR